MDGTHIPIVQPCENPHDYFGYKLKYALNVQGVSYLKGLFLDVDIKWPGSVHDERVFANSRLNRLLREERLPMCYKEVLPGHEKIRVTLLGDPVLSLLPYCMKEFPNAHSNEEVIFNMLQSARNQIECAYGHLKARCQILNKRIDSWLKFILTLIEACCVLHNICELRGKCNVISLHHLKMHETGFIHLTVPKELMWGILSHPTARSIPHWFCVYYFQHSLYFSVTRETFFSVSNSSW